MGTPDFALPCLVGMLKAGYTVNAVITQPDRPKGRHNI
ncbi:MAG: methionyl-tRNA formyltransferase, partial [Clostridia bacterium]